MSRKIWIQKNDQSLGPYSEEEAKRYLKSGQLHPTDPAAWEGDTKWSTLGKLTDQEQSVSGAGSSPQHASQGHAQASSSLESPAGTAGIGVPCRFHFSGTAMSLLSELIVGCLLLLITLGLYYPWFICRAHRWYTRNIILADEAGKQVKLEFKGDGGGLVVTFLVGFLLTLLTFGIYGFWFTISLHKFFVENTTGESSDGQKITLSFQGTGAEFFKRLFVGFLLLFLTLGIYTPWLICELHRFFTEKTIILVDGSKQFRFQFQGDGGTLLGTFLIGYLLSIVTLGIYSFWLQVDLMKFLLGNTGVTTPSGNQLKVDFTGTGGEYAKMNILGILLTFLTLGFYVFRFAVQHIEFQTNHLKITSA